MPSIIFKNQRLDSFVGARDLTPITQDLIFGRVGLPVLDISALNDEPSFLYSSDELTIALDAPEEVPEEEEPVDFLERVGEVFGSAGLSSPISTSSNRVIFTTPSKIRVNSFWNIASNSDVVDSSSYRLFETEVDILISTENQITFRLRPSEEMEVVESFNSLGVNKPDYGMLLIIIEFQIPNQSKFERSYLVKYTHSPLFSSPIFLPRTPVNFASNTYTSPGYSSETLFVPTLTSSFVYNFYEIEESEYEVYKARDYKGKKLSDIPKYVKLNWNKPAFNSEDFNRMNTRPSALSPSVISQISRVSSDFVISPELRSAIIAPREISRTPSSSNSLSISGRVISLAGNREQIAAAMASAPRLAAASDSAFVNPAVISDVTLTDISIIPRTAIHDALATKDSDYIGYVIEKYRITENSIDIELVDVIAIPDISTLEYIDTKISYGEVYRYVVKSVFRFVNNFDLPMFNDSDSSLNQRQTKGYIDSNQIVNLKKTYYYDSESSVPQIVPIEESQKPNPPSSVKGFANSNKKSIFLTWSQKNSNRDVLGFNVYRKLRSEKIYTKLNSEILNARQNFYLDLDLIQDTEYVYAVESVDVHGNFSALSAQIILKIKDVTNFDVSVVEYKQRLYRIEGFELNEDEVVPLSQLMIVKNELKINVNPLFRTPDDDNIFVIRATSLDTGQIKEFKLNFTARTIYHITPPEPKPARNWVVQLFESENLELIRNALR